jgi:peptidyl-Lys metalloendopeptidase
MGIARKRANPLTTEFIKLEAGETVSILVDLSKFYAIPDGSSTVALNTVYHLTNASLDSLASSSVDGPRVALSSLEMVPVSSDELKIVVQSAPQPTIPVSNTTLLGALIGCEGRESAVNSAIPVARQIASSVYSYMNSQCDDAYVRWMGSYANSNRWDYVQAGYSKIAGRLGGSFNVNCKGDRCGPSIFAYVFPGDSSFTIYVCGQFWQASGGVSFDSKPGTFVHEMSHFTAIQGTQDYTYGTSGAQNLAKSNPSRAVANADNYEYFAESQPRC